MIGIGIVLIVDIVLLALNYKNIINSFANNILYSPIVIILPIVVIILIELIFVLIGSFLATAGSNTASEYQAYKKAYKGYFIARQLASVFTDLNYNHEKGLDVGLLKKTGLIYTGDRYRSNDLVMGKYKQVGFLQADVCIEERTEYKDEDGHTETHYTTVFKGRYLIFEFPKKFDFKLVVSFNGYNGEYINSKTKRGLSRIETESPEFNKRFLVYAEDGFEAFYILDPAFIDNLEQLGKLYNNQLALYFSDNKLFVGLNDGGDAFEPPNPAEPINEKTETTKDINDMRLITRLVDSLKLNR